MKYCSKPNFVINYSTNIAIHVFILFAFLSTFFILYVSKLEKEKMESEFKSLITNFMQTNFNNLSSSQKTVYKQILNNLPIDQLIKLYQTPNTAVQVNNTWLYAMIIAINIFLFLFIFLDIILLYFSCNQCIPIGQILLENIIIFAFVGTIEFLFFQFVAIKYIPAPPSLLLNSVIDSLKKAL
jgi:hypothetical protein